jgi:hypothetical protein
VNTGEPIRFSCTDCGIRLRAAFALIGSKITCPACDARVDVPIPDVEFDDDESDDSPPLPTANPVPPPDVRIVRFRCLLCRVWLSGPSSDAGHEVECSRCGYIVKAPAESVIDTSIGEPVLSQENPPSNPVVSAAICVLGTALLFVPFLWFFAVTIHH